MEKFLLFEVNHLTLPFMRFMQEVQVRTNVSCRIFEFVAGKLVFLNYSIFLAFCVYILTDENVLISGTAGMALFASSVQLSKKRDEAPREMYRYVEHFFLRAIVLLGAFMITLLVLVGQFFSPQEPPLSYVLIGAVIVKWPVVLWLYLTACDPLPPSELQQRQAERAASKLQAVEA